MAEVIGTPLPYRGRTIYPTYTGEKDIIISYLASKTESERIASRYGTDFVFNDGKNPPEQYFVSIGAYPKGSNSLIPLAPAVDQSILNGVSNRDLTLAINQDPNFYKTVNNSPDNPTPPPTTPDPNQPGAPGGSTPTNPNTPEEQENQKPKVQRLTYPSDISDTQDRIKFTAHTYQSGIGSRLNPGDKGSFGELNPVTYNSVGSSVFLAIQSSITDQNSVAWESDALNPIEIQAAELSYGFMKSATAEQLGTVVSKSFGDAMRQAKYSGDQIRTYLVGQALGVNNLLSRLNGQVLNPNLELLFQGPQLRPFNFTFKLSPRSKEEAIEVKDIIKYFKKNMAVKKGTAIFLNAPNVFKIEYQYGNSDGEHPGLNLIKMCALTNCSVDYTPLGTYMTYPDGTMVSYNLSLQFQELTPVYEEDYTTFEYGDRTTISNPTIGA